MADEWIKMRLSLTHHPKVVTLMSRCSVTKAHGGVTETSTRVPKAHIIGALYVIWCMADRFGDGETGEIGADEDALDAEVGIPGFIEQLCQIGWAERTEKGLQFPRYQEHNGTTAKSRAQAARRQSSRRCHASVTQERDKNALKRDKNARERDQKEKEKEKEKESSKTTPLPPSLDTDRFRKAWSEWEAYRRDTKHRLTKRTIGMQLKKLEAMGHDDAIKSIEQSIEAGWQGLFDPKSDRQMPLRSSGVGKIGHDDGNENEYAHLVIRVGDPEPAP
jgi:hypothetical protein